MSQRMQHGKARISHATLHAYFESVMIQNNSKNCQKNVKNVEEEFQI